MILKERAIKIFSDIYSSLVAELPSYSHREIMNQLNIRIFSLCMFSLSHLHIGIPFMAISILFL